ncbi:MAG: hypothetical protein A2Z20_06835 [Bdellovibrionales bacterium RBG_16_40_8]|nr:MAG: hypothetical protein A2Z20_06835 [Bdellovibrionales bacterium RBG_16_40_8]
MLFKSYINIAIIFSISFLAFVMCPSSEATEMRQGFGQIENEKTSDDLDRTSVYLRWRNHRREISWPYESEEDQANDHGFSVGLHRGHAPGPDFSGQRISGFIGKKISPQVYFDFEAGIHHLRDDAQSLNKNILAVGGNLNWRPNDKLYVEVGLHKDLSYLTLQPTGQAESLTELACRPSLTYRPVEKLRLINRNNFFWFSDGNRKKESDIALMYGLATTTPWVWLGIGASYIEFARQAANYYSPEKFFSWGPRLEAVGKISEQISGVLGLSLADFQEGNLARGKGHYVSAAVRYGDRSDSLFEFQTVQVRSAQNARTWTSDIYSLSLMWSY